MTSKPVEYRARLAALGGMLHPVVVPVPAVAPERTSDQVKVQRAASRAALTRCAEIVGAPIDGWKQDPNRVPLPNAGFYWSVTHKRQWTAAVISDAPVGIDIEHVIERRRRTHDHVASEDEWRIVGPDTWDTFYRVWTAKEATLKTHGRGIGKLRVCQVVDASDPPFMRLSYEGHVTRVEHYEHDGHLLAVTCDERKVMWHVATDVVLPLPDVSQGSD